MKYLWFALILIVAILFVLLLEQLRRKTNQTLDQILYVDQNPKLYLECLKNPRLKFIYSKQTIQQLEFNAYLVLNDRKQIQKYINELSHTPMSKGEKLEFNMKKLSYTCLHQDKTQADEAMQAIEGLLAKNKNDKNKALLKESQTIYQVYIQHDIHMLDELEKQAQLQSGRMKSITLFRCAKLCYYAQDNEKAIHYLNLAKKEAKNSDMEQQIEACLNDLKLLKKY